MHEPTVPNLASNTPSASHELTTEQFKEALPKQIHSRVNTGLMKTINTVLADKHIREHFRDNLLSYTNVLQAGKFKLTNYIDAVKYVSFKLLGYTNKSSYSKTFPGRVNSMITEGATEKTISAYVSAYNKNKLVNMIWEQTLIPSYVLNSDVYQRAINTQLELMTTASSETVREKAADSLLTHLKPPEITKVEIDIGIKEDQTIKDLKAITAELAATQKKLIIDGLATPEKIAHSSLVVVDNATGEVVEEIPN